MPIFFAQMFADFDKNAIAQRPVLLAPFVLSLGILVGLLFFPFLKPIPIGILGFFLALVFYWLSTHARITNIAIFQYLAGLFAILSCFIFGLFLIILKANLVAAPIIKEKGNYSDIRGEITNISRTNFGNWRVLIKVTQIRDIEPNNLPKFVRMNIDNIKPIEIGRQISCNGFLAPPSGPVLPDAYNFALKSWFQKLGGVGVCKTFVLGREKNNKIGFSNLTNTLTQLRNIAALNITKGEMGGGKALLAALMTGNRSYISQSEHEAMQTSGLGHIVSVSGLHVGLLAAIIFFPLRKLLVLIPNAAIYFDVRKIAAIITFLFLAFYTFFTGAEAPALRALIMSGVAFAGLLLNRRAISMRALAISAIILLILFPEQAIDPGFQMSFLATMALIALWEWFEAKSDNRPKTILEKALFWPVAAGLTSLVAGLATIPITLLNFSSVNSYGLMANLIAAPISDFIIAPFAVIGGFLSLFGIGAIFLNIAAFGCDLVLTIAAFFAQLPQLNFNIGEFGGLSAALICFALVWACVFFGRIRVFAIIPLIVGVIIWIISPTPQLYISSNGRAFFRPFAAGKEAKLCFIKNGSYDARLLLNTVSIDAAEKRRLIAISNQRENLCGVNNGNFEAHFIAKSRANPNEKAHLKNQENPASTQEAPALLSITMLGKSYWIAQNAPIGAKIYEKNGSPYIFMPMPPSAPWFKAPLITNAKIIDASEKINSDDKAIQEPLEP